MCNSYNGYKNYETWNVSLWIDNDEGSYNFVRDMAQEFYDDNPDHAIYNLSQWLKDYHEENNPVTDASVYSDLMQSALDNVDWYEIAENWIETIKEEEE
jgi:hypothetical protein